MVCLFRSLFCLLSLVCRQEWRVVTGWLSFALCGCYSFKPINRGSPASESSLAGLFSSTGGDSTPTGRRGDVNRNETNEPVRSVDEVLQMNTASAGSSFMMSVSVFV